MGRRSRSSPSNRRPTAFLGLPPPTASQLALCAGENRLLVKHTNLHNAHGFAFNVPALSGLSAPDDADVMQVVASQADRFTSFTAPYASARRAVGNAGHPLAGLAFRSVTCPMEDVPRPGTPRRGTPRRRCYRHLADALALLYAFRFDVTPLPMLDPPRLRMHELLEQTVPHTPEARAYLDRLAGLGTAGRGGPGGRAAGKPGADEAAVRAAEAIRAMFQAEIRRLPPIVFIRQPLYVYTAIGPYYLSVSPVPQPSSLCLFDPARPDDPPRVIHDEPQGGIYDASLSYDARPSSSRPTGRGSKAIGRSTRSAWTAADCGSSLAAPAPTSARSCCPAGEIMFVSTRRGTYVQCQPAPAGLLHVMDRDGSRLRRVSANIDADQSPQVMDDGRVLFSRWDYGIEKSVYGRQALWTMHPDGTGLDLFFGNTIEDPLAFWTAVPVPYRPEVVCVLGPHHCNQAGSLGLAWNRLGQEAPRGEGFRWMTREVPSQGDLTFRHGYSRPWPIHECLFLCSLTGATAGSRTGLPGGRPRQPPVHL